MQTFFYKLSGGINTAFSKTVLGQDTKTLYWSDAQNVEILKNNGIVKQKGNTLLLSLEESSQIIGLHELKDDNNSNLLIATAAGKLYVYLTATKSFVTLDKTVSGISKINFVDFLDGVVVGSKSDALFYINNDAGYTIESCNLSDSSGNSVKADVFCVFAGRIWVANGATLYYSALGKYNDFTTSNDAGYINNFFNDTNDISALKTYQNYLAIYKPNSVYLLSGSSNDDFSISPFADRGTSSFNGVINVNNKQYFVGKGIFTLEQAGLLSQIQLGEEISLAIKPEFDLFDKTRFDEIIVLNYYTKNQMWFFIPYSNDNYFHTIWIYDYVQSSWFKRVLPQDITHATLFDDKIITADKSGNVYYEDLGSSFNGEAIDFYWKSPFLATGNSNIRKTIDEFYFILDEAYDNNFKFAVCKDYDDVSQSDEDSIFSSNLENLIWYDENSTNSNMNFVWNYDADDTAKSVYAQWAIPSEAIYKAAISGSNYSVQLCVNGNEIAHGMAIIGLEFKSVYADE